MDQTNGPARETQTRLDDVDDDPTGETQAAAIAMRTLTSTSLDKEIDTMINLEDAAADLQLQHFATSVFEKEKSLGRFGLRSKQAILHHSLTDMRINELETELRELKNAVYGMEEEVKAKPSKDRFPIHRHELRRSNRINFRVNRMSLMRPPSHYPALEVQISDRAPAFEATEETDLVQDEGEEGKLPAGEHLRTPERLRIRSRPLMAHLERITGESMLSLLKGDPTDTDALNSVVFLRPFKFLVKHEGTIRESLKELEFQMLQKPTPAAKTVKEPAIEAASTGKEFDNQDLLEDLKLLIRFFDEDLRPTLDLRQNIAEGKLVEIEYADLWHLFKRGEIVIQRFDQTHAYRIVNIAGGRDPLSIRIVGPHVPMEPPSKTTRLEGFMVDCISINSNGSAYVPKLETFSIKTFSGTLPITSLPIYPLRFEPTAKLRKRLIDSGKAHVEVTRLPFAHRNVLGRTLDEPSNDLDAQVIVDMTLAMDAEPKWRLKPVVPTDTFTKRDHRETFELSWCIHVGEACCGSDFCHKDLLMDERDDQSFLRRMGRVLGPLQAKDLEEDDFMLMRPFVHAFVLRSRQWVTVRTADLRPVGFENTFDDLVVPDDHSQTVRALVQTHENARARDTSSAAGTNIGASLDLVKGKGGGLIILLHGPPGVGKTSTAECVADDTRRPLYPITCGDIGETAAQVESNLQSNFRLAHKWGCVLLLDEADVFLAKRTRSDLRHNAVTSVFLRSLEYYAGILFLTTNRIGAIDPAFKSRIQMSLSYPKLTLEVTLKLYEKFVKRTKEAQNKSAREKTTKERRSSDEGTAGDSRGYLFKIKEKEILKFAKKHFRELEKRKRDTWNGRQIRNAFQTAIALTEHQSMMAPDEPIPSLGKHQFEIVARGFKEFDDYLFNVVGGTEGDEARRDKWRDDAPPTPPTLPSPSASSSRYGKHAGRRNVHVSESEDSESDSESEDESDEEPRTKKSGAEKTLAVDPDEEGPTASGDAPSDFEGFKEYLAWKRMQKKRKS